MRRRMALAGGWLATTAVATAACALAVSLVTSDITEPRRDALAAADLRSIEVASGESASPSGSETIDLELAVDQAPDAPRSARTFVSQGGVLVASCPDPVLLLSARPHDGYQVVVPERGADVIEVRFAGASGTEVHLASCDADGVRVDTPPATELAGPPPEPSSTTAATSGTGATSPDTGDVGDRHHDRGDRGDEDDRRHDGGRDRPRLPDRRDPETRDEADRDEWPDRHRDGGGGWWDRDHDRHDHEDRDHEGDEPRRGGGRTSWHRDR